MDFGIAGFYVSILGIIISLIIFVLTTKYKRPVFFIEFNCIIHEIALNSLNIKKVKLLYDNKEIQSLSKTLIFVWNKGRRTIRHSDLLIDKPFGVHFENTNILEINYATTDAMSKSFTLDINDEERFIKFTFDSMSQNQGVLIEILHTSSNRETFKLIGDIDDAVKLEDNKKTVRMKALGGLIISAVWLFTMIVITILSVLGKIDGGIFGYGFGHGNGSGISYFISQIGSMGVLTILFLPGFLFVKYFENKLKFLPDSIMNLKNARKENFY